MALAKFSIIVAVDANNGIAKQGSVPWSNSEASKFFRDTTIGKRKNAVIMGRLTYENIPQESRPLEGRRCVVISREWRQEEHSDISVYPSLIDALAGLGATVNAFDDVFIVGGEQVFKEAIKKFMYLCKRLYVTKLKTDYACDQYFPFDVIKDYPRMGDVIRTRDYSRHIFNSDVYHDEYEYLHSLELIKTKGETKMDRTGTGVVSLFGVRMQFDLRDRIPILTTKKIAYELIIKELLFFISGKTDTNILSQAGVKIWEANTRKPVLEKLGLPYDEGDMGEGYGFQWKHFGAEYEGCHTDYSGQGFDQLKYIVETIRNDPSSRRLILTAWNPAQIHNMALPPCHVLAQFNVSGDRKYLDCQLYQRSGDMFLGVPFNVTSYALLTYMIAHITGLKARKLIHIIGDAHIYNTHGEQVKKQLLRTPRPFPTLAFREASRLHELDDFTFNSFIIESYSSWPSISADMAI